MKNKLIILVCVLVSLSIPRAMAQYIVHDTLAITQVLHAQCDLEGNLYLADANGVLTKCSPKGDTISVFDAKALLPTSLQVVKGFKIFLFYQPQQEYIMLDRYLRQTSGGDFSEEEIGIAAAATMSFDNKLWVVDQQSGALSKLNTILHDKEYTTNLSAYDLSDVILFQEHQNQLYLLTDQYLLCFDVMGNIISEKIFEGGMKNALLYKGGLYLLYNDVLKVYDLYDGKIKQIQVNEDLRGVNRFLIDDQFLYLFEKTKTVICIKK